MSLGVNETLILCEKLIALSIFFQTIEYFMMSQTLSNSGIWRWKTLALDYSRPIGRILGFALNASNFHALLWIRIFGSIALVLESSPLTLICLFVTSFLISVRFRGAFNGGSDSMTLMVLGCLMVTSLGGKPVAEGALWFLSIQIALSFFLAGVAKSKHKNWWNGQALTGFLHQYPSRGAQVLSVTPVLQISSWAVILFELAFPLALFSENAAIVFVGAALVFHLANVYLFRLNRFFFAWAAAYPALIYCSHTF